MGGTYWKEQAAEGRCGEGLFTATHAVLSFGLGVSNDTAF